MAFLCTVAGHAAAAATASTHRRSTHSPVLVNSPARRKLYSSLFITLAYTAAVGLMCSGAPAPSDQLRSLAGDLSASAVAFVSLCTALNATAGPSLAKELSKLATGLATPCLALIKEMVRHYLLLSQLCCCCCWG